ncbi:transcription factor FER-like iron deficiency-induced transcription factor-like protein [Tanacetum coccineum]
MSGTHLVAGERIPYEAFPASIPQRHVAGDTFPQRHVAGENPDMSPGKRAIVVVYSYSIGHFNNRNFNMFQPDFIPETDFENLLSAIRCETTDTDPIEKFCPDYTCHHFTDACTAMQLSPQLYGHNEASDVIGISNDNASGTSNGNCADSSIDCYDVFDPSLNLMWDQNVEDVKVFGDDDSSETVTIRNPDTQRRSGGGVKGDRTRTLISERKRRSGMKEKLYALRALVPYITKMDKASIVGDSARYIQDLQTQARTLRSEIATIEATKNQKMSSQNLNKTHVSNSLPVLKNISKMDMFNVDEKEYYVRLICNKGRGVAVALHKALESITSFQVQSSNLATIGDDIVLTFTLNVTACEFDINLQNLKLWVSGAFLNQGFKFNTFPSP